MSCWSVLGITPTKNINKIKLAYVELSSCMDINNKDFEELQGAYNKALSLANASISDLNINLLGSSNFDILSALINSSVDNKTIDSIDKFIDRINEIYNNPLLRFNKENWVNILTLPLLNKDSLTFEIELIKYIYKHKYIPNNIYLLLNSRFNWTNRVEELKCKLPIKIVKFLINEIDNPLPLTYNYLSSISPEKLEEYLVIREKAYLSMKNNNSELNKQYLLDAYSLYTKDFDLLKLLGTYYLGKNDSLMALNYFREAININSNDMYCLSNFGHLLTKTGQYSSAILYLEKYLKKLKNSIDIACIIDLAYCYHYSYELQKAKDLYILLLNLRPWDLSIKIELQNINNKLSKDDITLPLTIPIYKKYINKYLDPLNNKLKEIYNDFSLRINENSWNEILSLPIASNETLFYLFEQNTIDFITNNKNIPKNIFIYLNTYFDWTSRYDELISIYPNLKIDFLFNKIYLNENLSYDFFRNIDFNDLEEYIDLRSIAYDLVITNSNEAENYLNRAVKLYDSDFELYKLYGQYYSNNNLYNEAIESFKKVLSFKNDDYYSICSLAVLLIKVENYKEALYYLDESVNTPAGSMLLDNEDFLTKYAISFYYTNNLFTAKKYFKKLYKLNPKLNFVNIYLKNINNRLYKKDSSVIPISTLTAPDCFNSSFKYKTKNKLYNIVNKFKHNLAN